MSKSNILWLFDANNIGCNVSTGQTYPQGQSRWSWKGLSECEHNWSNTRSVLVSCITMLGGGWEFPSYIA